MLNVNLCAQKSYEYILLRTLLVSMQTCVLVWAGQIDLGISALSVFFLYCRWETQNPIKLW